MAQPLALKVGDAPRPGALLFSQRSIPFNSTTALRLVLPHRPSFTPSRRTLSARRGSERQRRSGCQRCSSPQPQGAAHRPHVGVPRLVRRGPLMLHASKRCTAAQLSSRLRAPVERANGSLSVPQRQSGMQERPPGWTIRPRAASADDELAGPATCEQGHPRRACDAASQRLDQRL